MEFVRSRTEAVMGSVGRVTNSIVKNSQDYIRESGDSRPHLRSSMRPLTAPEIRDFYVKYGRLLPNVLREAKPATSSDMTQQAQRTKGTLGDEGGLVIHENYTQEDIVRLRRQEPMGVAEWLQFFDSNGRVNDPDSLRRRVYMGGVEPHLRREVWKFLLGVTSMSSTTTERRRAREAMQREYYVYRAQWKSITEAQVRRFDIFREGRDTIDKDVPRTDRNLEQFEHEDSPWLAKLKEILTTYVIFNVNLGYVQGMNDVAAVFLLMMEDEADSFWCFKHWMDTVEENFRGDLIGVFAQLKELSEILEVLDPEFSAALRVHVDTSSMFWCFQWILLCFKREFEIDDLHVLWEAIWTCPFARNFQLFVAVAMISRHRDRIVHDQIQFDGLVSMFNKKQEVSVLWLIEEADTLCRRYRRLRPERPRLSSSEYDSDE